MSSPVFHGGLCNCGGCGPCMSALFCTACMYGRYAKALEEYPHLPPSNDSMSYFNFDCAMFWLMGSVFANFVPVWLKRTEHRRKFGIEGTTVEDCCTAYWCLGCALAQQNLDIQERAQENAPVVTAMPYKTGEKMTYSRPQDGGVVTTTTETVPQ